MMVIIIFLLGMNNRFDIPVTWKERNLCSPLNTLKKCLVVTPSAHLWRWTIFMLLHDYIFGKYVANLSLPPGCWNEILHIYVIFKLDLVIDGWGISCEIAPRWMSLDFIDD